jgi:hypothetical protein
MNRVICNPHADFELSMSSSKGSDPSVEVAYPELFEAFICPESLVGAILISCGLRHGT